MIQPVSNRKVNSSSQKTLHYKNSHFATQLPVEYLYTRAHCWAAEETNGVWRIGFTKFATRMLGEIVDHKFDVTPATAVALGQTLGWIEGFKAISDLFCIAEGEFVEGNPALKENIEVVNQSPYNDGWLYKVRGKVDPAAGNVHTYVSFLDATIQKMLEKQKQE